MAIRSLIINPGSTSTKIGVFEDESLLFDETLRHTTEEIAQYDKIVDQIDFRKDVILNFLKEKDVDIKSFDVIVGRGGLLKPIPSGTYAVTDKLVEDLKNAVGGEHASNLGGILAKEIADEIGVPSYIVDPVVVDELSDVARLSGVPELPRVSIFHALNQKAVAKRYAKENGKKYDELRLIVVHMGGGVSVGAGMLIDIQQDAKSAARDVVEFRTVNDHVAVGTLEQRSEAAFCLAAGSVVEVADDGSRESSFLFVNSNIHISIPYLLMFFVKVSML